LASLEKAEYGEALIQTICEAIISNIARVLTDRYGLLKG
jgi:hypothetical protein